MRKVISLLIAMLLLSLTFTSAYAGLTYQQLQDAGYTCINTGPYNFKHCFPPYVTIPSDLASGKYETIQVKVFNVEGTTFLGTELLVRVDIYNGQPCPRDGGTYDDLRPTKGIPYFGCHHFSRTGQLLTGKRDL